MKKEVRTVVYNGELHIEAYRFEDIVQPFPNHFHEYHVIGFIEDGQRFRKYPAIFRRCGLRPKETGYFSSGRF